MPRSRPPLLLIIAVAMLAGDFAGEAEQASIVAVGSLLVALLIALIPVRAARQWRLVVAAALAAVGFSCAAAASVYHPNPPSDDVSRLPLPLRARVTGTLVAAEERAKSDRFLIDVAAVDAGDGEVAAGGLILLYVRQVAASWEVGDRIRAQVTLRRPRNFGNPGEFDYAAYLARRGVRVTAFAYDDSGFDRLEPAGRSVRGLLDGWRNGLRQLFADVLPAKTAAVLRALILGEAAALPDDLRNAFSRSGVRHVLTISGLHVGMVAAGAYALFRWLLGRSHWLLLYVNVPKLTVGLSIVPVAIYAGLAGGSLATTRAVIMALVFLGAVVVDRRRHLLVSLAAAAVVMIAAAPGSTREISFQLSFAAVLGLVVGLGRFWPWWRAWEERHLIRLRGRRAAVWRWLAVYLVVSASALAATLPLTAFHFNQVSAMALVSNAVVVPLLGSATVALGLAAAVIYLVSSSLAAAVVWLAGVVVLIGIECVRLFAAFPYAMLRVPTPTVLELTTVYAALLAAVVLHGRRRVVALTTLAALACANAVWWYADRVHPDELRVTFLSVGQGDSAVVEFPGGEVMVVDGGGLGAGSFDVGERIIAPFLLSRRIVRVDCLVVTHPQFDHYGGLGYLVENFRPRELWSTGAASASASYAALLEAARTHGVEGRVMQRGEGVIRGGVDVVVAFPPRHDVQLGVNDGSMVLALEYGGTRVLLTGDIEAAAERLLLSSTAELASAVAKVPHHGSSTSSTPAFVNAVRPRLAVVSAGYGNRYGLPSPRVLGRYAAGASRILRTDLDGAVEVRIRSDGTVWAKAHGSVQALALVQSDAPAPNANFRFDTSSGSGISVEADA